MNICLLNDSFPPVIDGVANVVKNYADLLHERPGTAAAVGTTFYPQADYGSFPYPVYAWPGLQTEDLTGGYRTGYPFAVKQIGSLLQFSPDIIHTHCPFVSCLIARSLRDASGAPIVFTYHTKYDIDIRRSVSLKILQEESIKAVVHNISACDEVWVVSRGAGENLNSLGYEGEWKVVRNGVDFPKGQADEADVIEAVKDYDLPADIPVFLFVGRLMNYKGLPMIAEALRILGEENDFRMVFIGSGPDEASLKEAVLQSGLSLDERQDDGSITSHNGTSKNGRVIFTGPIRDRNVLRAWNTRADLFVFPSTFDTNGLVVREAAACGLGAVMIRNSCAAEDITDGTNGFLCDENGASLAAFLKFACSHREEIKGAGRKAMNEIYLSWNDAVGYAEQQYRELLIRKKNGLLPQRPVLADDPLYKYAADAAVRYAKTADRSQAFEESMMDNFPLLQLGKEIRENIESQVRKALRL